jgi:hypothetical protein
MINLNSMTLSFLDSHIKKLVCTERQVTDQILKAIIELDARRGYAELGFSSLFTYLTLGVGYSESSAQRRIAAARLMAKVSEPIKDTLRDKLKVGAINLSQLSKIGSLVRVIEQNKASEEINTSGQFSLSANLLVENLLPQIENKGLAKTESVIADFAKDLCPELSFEKPEKAKIRNEAGGKVTITLSLSKEQNEKLQKVLAKKSHAIPDGNINILFEKLLDKELKGFNAQVESALFNTTVENVAKEEVKGLAKKVEKRIVTEDVVTKATIANTQNPSKRSKSRKYISIKIKRRVLAKAENHCQYISPITGERCQETKYLTLDHIRPLALGGTDDEQNIQCLCFCHNQVEARRMGIGRN